MKKSSILAFFLAVIPGFGHMYLGYRVRGILYPLFFFGSFGLAFLVGMIYNDGFFLLVIAGLVWGVNMLDMVITLLIRVQIQAQTASNTNNSSTDDSLVSQNERFSTILLSFIPGVGQFYMGLNHRGLTLLTGFFGVLTMIFFVALVTNQGGFLIFLLALPIIWIYSFFDAVQLLNKKQKGEALEDRTIMDDFNNLRDEGKKSKMLATLLSIFPGAGHMYLGLQNRGLQLMVGFLLSIYILDVLRLSIFLFLIPIIWFYSFFDALQQVNRVEQGEAKDIPVVSYFVNHQKWLGVGLVLLGTFYLFDSIVIPAIAHYFESAFYYYNRYFQVSLVSLLLIGGGIKLMFGSKKKRKGEDQ